MDTRSIPRRTRRSSQSGMSVVRAGLLTGLVGAGAVALWLLLVDTVLGQPLATPALLGSTLLGIGTAGEPATGLVVVAAYSAFHVALFSAVGVGIVWFARLTTRFPSLLYPGTVLFAFLEVGFLLMVSVFAPEVIGELAPINLTVANAIAALAMGVFVWRTSPALRRSLRLRPLGALDEPLLAPAVVPSRSATKADGRYHA